MDQINHTLKNSDIFILFINEDKDHACLQLVPILQISKVKSDKPYLLQISAFLRKEEQYCDIFKSVYTYMKI